MNKARPTKKIFVGMSGGVDSSVSAALLVKAGHDVTGVFIRVWQPDWIECNWREERLDAMRAAAHLGIPFVTLDLEREYKEGVIDYMIAEYAAGRTPNPDVMCNREVKFGAFWDWARKHGTDAIATGHYARIERDLGSDDGDHGIGSRYRLLAGTDKNKDQSYFLWTLGQADLEHVLFPVGHLEKPKVRALARKFGLPNADKKDSQGLCFIGKMDVKEFLSHYIHTEPGDVLNEKGAKIGTHPGSLLFTIGERHGFTITEKTPNDAPYYIVAKDMTANTITVSNRKMGDTAGSSYGTDSIEVLEQNLMQNRNGAREARIAHVSWTNSPLKEGDHILARSRYREPLLQAVVASIANGVADGASGSTRGATDMLTSDTCTATILFKDPQETLSPGQSLVMYDGEECLGGGILV